MRFAINLLYSFVIIFLSLSFVSASSVGLIENQTWQQNLTGVRWATTALGDINNDGKLDLVLTGCLTAGASDCNSGTISKVYLNNGTSFTENQTWQQNLTGLGWATTALGDINNDGKLDLVLTGCTSATGSTPSCSGSYISKVYLNNGTSFVESQTWEQNLTPSFYGSTALGDINNDGKLDLVLSGVRDITPNYITKVYLNNGTSFTENQTWQQNLIGVYEGTVALGDLNKDGYLDLALTGDAGSSDLTSKIYLNNGVTFNNNSVWEQNIISMDRSTFLFGDYNNDGYLDLALTGHTSIDNFDLYNNNATTLLLNQSDTEGVIAGLYRASMAFGDYNNDGYLDLVSIGYESGRARVYENNLSYFIEDNTAHANISNGWYQGSLSWGDINNDTLLDLIICGNDALIQIACKVYFNNGTINNTIPQPPNSSFSAIYENNQISLGWGNGSDNETPTAGLYYNLKIGTASGGNQIVSGIYGGLSGGSGGGGPSTGYFGNMMQRKNISLGGEWLKNNTTYYWSVQTIDTGLAKSSWSSEQTFTTAGDITSPTITLNSPPDNNFTSLSNIIFSANISDNVAVSNVSLYGSWGGWHRNQTNSSGLNGTDYLFQVNLSGYPEGSYTWAIHACDTTGNCRFSDNRTIIRDLTTPLIYLEFPANASSWTDNNSVLFSFNVTDLAIQNCSLVIGSSLKYNFTSLTVNTSTSATVSLENGNYNWSVNCTDLLGRQNSSSLWQLAVNYNPPVLSGNSGGGGGAAAKTYTEGSLIEGKEVSRLLGRNDKVKFNLNNNAHSLTLKSILQNSITLELNSTHIIFSLLVGESRKFNLTSAELYDLYVKLGSIAGSKANVTILAIKEQIPASKPVIEEEKKPEEKKNATSPQYGNEKTANEKEKSVIPLIWWTVFISLAVIFYSFFKHWIKK